ncbi:hypothetical protein DL95DRAFT_394595 [Leptodontidium sp. 2 PMI_412]|nr:hypothetical protein DL95DRAFT_394595 [Leptodontidium sp. 2 PMI_412]
MTPRLEKCFTMCSYISVEDTLDLKTIRNGNRRTIVPITHGFITGSGLDATIIQGGSDRVTLDEKLNIAYLDVRLQARTANGHAMHVHYTGVVKLDEAGNKVLGKAPDAQTTNYGDHHWFSAPVMETSDENFKWVESNLFVGEGHYVVNDGGNAVEYQIFKVVN